MQYRKITIKENGQPGNLFYAWILSISLFVIAGIGLIILLTSK
jgi:hypothetical protein